jgi:DNA polymerase-3 subunit delta
MITLIHGPAELLRSEALAAIRGRIADDPALADLNTAHLDGRRTTVAEIQNACDALPFLAERRLVVVEGLLHRLTAPARPRKGAAEAPKDEVAEPEEEVTPELTKAQGKALLAYLDQIPATTELILVEDDTVGSGAVLRRLLELQEAGKAKVILCARPRKNELPDWIRARARLRHVKLEPAAVADLADFVGDELRQLDQELIKLADYAADGRTITRADVRRLVPATRAASVFELADALGMGDTATAGRLMQHALDADSEPPLRLLAMIGRQYRLLILAKALQAQGARPADIARDLDVAEWTVPKLLTQASRHTFAGLERAMERLLAADEAIKRGKMADREAMDVLLAELMTREA